MHQVWAGAELWEGEILAVSQGAGPFHLGRDPNPVENINLEI